MCLRSKNNNKNLWFLLKVGEPWAGRRDLGKAVLGSIGVGRWVRKQKRKQGGQAA